MKQLETDKMYMQIAEVVAKASKANKLKVAAVLVSNSMIIAEGCNGTLPGFDNQCEDENGCTITGVIHAEANAILKVAASTHSTKGATMYILYAPCISCALMIARAGISRVVYRTWYKRDDGINLLKKAGIIVEHLNIENNE